MKITLTADMVRAAMAAEEALSMEMLGGGYRTQSEHWETILRAVFAEAGLEVVADPSMVVMHDAELRQAYPAELERRG